MDVPFTVRQFLEVFRNYNEAIWPAQILAYFIGLVCVVALISRFNWRANLVLWSLAVFWAWNGIAYHWMFFRSFNPAAGIFAILFVGQSVLFAVYGSRLLRNVVVAPFAQFVGWAMTAYAMAGYGVLGYALGRTYPESPIFGVAPCPMTIFTLGTLTLLGSAIPSRLLAMPVIWAIVGTSAAVSFGITEDFGLPVAAALAIWIRLGHGKTQPSNGRQASVAGS